MIDNQVNDIIALLETRAIESKHINNDLKTYESVNDFLMSEEFRRNLEKLYENGNYNTNEIVAAFYPLIRKITEGTAEEFKKYLVNYSTSLSFPNSFEITRDERYDNASKIFITLFSVFCNLETKLSPDLWTSRYPLRLIDENERKTLEYREEYDEFSKAFKDEFVYEMMKITQDIVGYTTLDHVSGVHFLAVKIARQIKHTGLPIDLGRVSGAAAGHDIGKFGCVGEEKKRVAYYHYYYTGEWFDRHKIVYIRNVAINHSTWDLELENLSFESLILIYCDFRVKEDKNHKMKFFTLDESFNIILNKLDNVDLAKEKRYRRVYEKLKDFENYLLQLKVNVNPHSHYDIDKKYEPKRKYYALMQGDEIIENAKFASIEHNIKLMHMLRNESSLNKMLESARDVKDLSSLRGYIEILEEYSTYLTQKQKLISLKFLYERLVIPEEDIRKQCAKLIGIIIGNFDEELRKEIPTRIEIEDPMISGIDLFKKYIEEILHPDLRIIDKHRGWISLTAKHVLEEYFRITNDNKKRKKSIDFLMSIFKFDERYDEDLDIHLLEMIKVLPISEFQYSEQEFLLEYILNKFDKDNFVLRLTAEDALYEVLDQFIYDEKLIEKITNMIHSLNPDMFNIVESFSIYKIARRLNISKDREDVLKNKCRVNEKGISSIFLSNLKTATSAIVKKLQTEILFEYTTGNGYINGFYTSMHYCNLLKVSASESVREVAGKGLIKIIPYLSNEQKNDIVIELFRALEMESYQFTRYIPEYLGRLLLKLEPSELDETIDEFMNSIRKSNSKISMLVLKTMGFAINYYKEYRITYPDLEEVHKERLKKILGILFYGFVNYDSRVNQTAFRVIGKYIFASNIIDNNHKKEIFTFTCKKILELMANTDETKELVFYNNSAGLMHIYRFISEYNFLNEEKLFFNENKKIAFFPGAFDPFTLSHKQIAKEIRNLGFEVYLAIDEFSWSKRTQPNLIRRNIVKMSVADEIGIYSFPRDLPINIANEKDMKRLKLYFKNLPVYIVVGSDVILNASAYRGKPKENSVATFPHVIFERFSDDEEENNEEFNEKFSILDERSIVLKLPMQYESISSTRIRNYIDQNRDISELIDPLVQRYIYDKGLYQREPQFKEVMTTKAFNMDIIDDISEEIFQEISSILDDGYNENDLRGILSKNNTRILIMRRVGYESPILGFAAIHWIRSKDIYVEFEDEVVADYIRDNSVGRIISIDGICINESYRIDSIEQRILTETLAFCLSKDYSYAVFNNLICNKLKEELKEVLESQGFLKIIGKTKEVYYVNMTSPCTLSLDCSSMFKEPFRSNKNIKAAILESRKNLQKALLELYPGNLVLSFDRTMIYENLIKKICDENNVSTFPQKPRKTGELMCVPFGAIFRRWILPNTVTKSMHLEKYFAPSLKHHEIEAYPYYLDLENQVKTLKSFNRRIILVDDLLNKGYRLKALDPVINKYNLKVEKIFVGILSGRGKALMEKQNREVDSAYFIPRLKVWFNESKLYPFLGGDALWRGEYPERNLIPSINLILPYSSMAYVKGVSQEKLYNLSKICLENTIRILSALENEYQIMNERMLTISHFGEVIVYPRYPDKGHALKFDMNMKASDYLKNDLEQLERMETILG